MCCYGGGWTVGEEGVAKMTCQRSAVLGGAWSRESLVGGQGTLCVWALEVSTCGGECGQLLGILYCTYPWRTGLAGEV